mgnify:CR=1 FL=1
MPVQAIRKIVVDKRELNANEVREFFKLLGVKLYLIEANKKIEGGHGLLMKNYCENLCLKSHKLGPTSLMGLYWSSSSTNRS